MEGGGKLEVDFWKPEIEGGGKLEGGGGKLALIPLIAKKKQTSNGHTLGYNHAT